MNHRKAYASAGEAKRSKDVVQNGHEVFTDCPCGQVHTRKPEKAATPRKAAPRNTGPSRLTRAMVFARDGGLCCGCGKACLGVPHSVQHRVARGMGGTRRPEANSFENLVLLCGSATSPGGCHTACEKRDPEMHRRGLWLDSWELPALFPVAYAIPGALQEYWLTDDCARVTAPPSEVAA